MSRYNDRFVLRNTLPNNNNGTIYVFEKVQHEDHLSQIKGDHVNQLKEDRLNQRIKSLTNENEVLEEMLKIKASEISKLDKQFRQKMEQYSELKHERDLLEMQLQSEIRNSNRLNRDVHGLLSTNKMLLDHIDRLKSEHIEDLRKRLECSKKH